MPPKGWKKDAELTEAQAAREVELARRNQPAQPDAVTTLPIEPGSLIAGRGHVG